jgi:Fe-S cluster assembly protein SufD
MKAEALQRELDTRGKDLPGSGETLRRRRTALADLTAIGLPTPRRENWRYTDLKKLEHGSYDVLPSPPDRRTIEAAAERLTGLPGAALRLVFVDGHAVGELGSGGAVPGLELGDLRTHWGRFEHRPGTLDAREHPLSSLNTAFVQQGVWLRLAAGARVPDLVHLVFVASGRPGLAPQPRISIELGREAQLTVVEHHIDVGEPSGWINGVTEIDLAAASRLTLYRLQEHGREQVHTSLLTADLAADAALSLGYVDLGGRLIRNDIEVRLREPGASTELFGVFVAGAEQHVDDHTRVDHIARETRSDEAFRGIVGRRGRGVFNGKVVVHRDAQRIDARLSNDNLLLGEQAEIDTKPELEIYADDVKCSHGSTVGELDPEQLFYLRSRGVPEQAARELLTTAFAASVLERIGLAELKEQIVARVAHRLRTLTAEEPS